MFVFVDMMNVKCSALSSAEPKRADSAFVGVAYFDGALQCFVEFAPVRWEPTSHALAMHIARIIFPKLPASIHSLPFVLTRGIAPAMEVYLFSELGSLFATLVARNKALDLSIGRDLAAMLGTTIFSF